MSNTKTTKRALLTSVMALMLCFAMLTGTTFAWFTDTETSAGNKIVAGNLDVQLLLWDGEGTAESDYADIGESSAPIFGSADKALNSLNTLWEPGKTQVAYLAIANAGNLELKYMVNLDTRDTDAEQNLYEAMSYVIVPDASYGSDIVWADIKDGALSVTPGIFAVSPSTNLSVDGVHYFALVIHMDENAGNEYQGGQVEFDINVLATQLNAEEDAFGKDYDKNANFDKFGYGVIAVEAGKTDYDFRVEDILNSTQNSAVKIGQVNVPAAAVDEDATEIKVTIEKLAEANDEVTVTADQKAETYDITFEGLKENNTTPIKVTLEVGTGLTGVKVFHEDEEITPIVYDSTEGTVTFYSAKFSPYTIVYDEVAQEIVKGSKEDKPKAVITVKHDYIGAENQKTWSGHGAFQPVANLDSVLDAAFTYSLGESVNEAQSSYYSDWYCDFYVKLDRPLSENQIFLAGSYGTYLNIGFHVTEEMLNSNGLSGTLPANNEVPLLAAAIGGDINTEFTYSSIAALVNEFTCGVGDVDGSLAGATFTVSLRLTNPENTSEYIDTNVVKYKFGSDVVDVDGTETSLVATPAQ